MKILYHLPSAHTISAGRVYAAGFKNAFLDLGHQFQFLTNDDDQVVKFLDYQPDIFLTGLNDFSLKYLDLSLLKKARKQGTKVFVNTPFWTSPFSRLRVNEVPSLKDNSDHISLIRSRHYGDIFYNIGEQGDPRMEGFESTTGYVHHTLPLAADKTFAAAEYSPQFAADISFIGTYLPGRRAFMKENVFPLRRKYDLRLYCQDLSVWDRTLNFGMKVGQYFNVPLLKSFKKNNVTFEQERQIFASSTLCLNIHEQYQKDFGMDCNDRTFKVPLYGGFEITDDVQCIRKYFTEGKEIIIAKDAQDWREKIDYYLRNPEKRLPIIKAGRARVLKDHTYHNRVQTLLKWQQKLETVQ